ncbi:MAG: hypothetical protein H7X92_12270 [Chitinophagales bacterium]|nr:hypothetical protein [Hyphomicrobiales bacterium]
MAYADNALNADEMAKIEAFLATDAAARDMVDMFRRTRDLSAMAFAEPVTAPSPQRLVDTVLNSTPRTPVNRQRSAHLAFQSGWRVAAPMAFAASVAFVIGLGAGIFSTSDPQDRTPAVLATGKLEASSSLVELLEKSPSGASVKLSRHSKTRAAVQATFFDQNKRACRDIEVFATPGQEQPNAAGIACRESDGSWSVEGAVRVGSSETAGSQYSPAGSQDNRALDSVLTAIGAGAAIPPDEESALIAREWHGR